MRSYKRRAERKKEEETTPAPAAELASIMDEKRHMQRGRTHTRSTKQDGAPVGEDDEELGTILHEKHRIATRKQHRHSDKRDVVVPNDEAKDSNYEDVDTSSSFIADKQRIARKGGPRPAIPRTPPQTHPSAPRIEPGAVRVGEDDDGTVQILSDNSMVPEPATDDDKSRSDFLVPRAHLVEDEQRAENHNEEQDKVLATATPVPDPMWRRLLQWLTGSCWRRNRRWLLGGAFVVVVGIVITLVVLSWRRNRWWLLGGAFVVVVGIVVTLIVLSTQAPPTTESPSMPKPGMRKDMNS